jgi:hypothetical protein
VSYDLVAASMQAAINGMTAHASVSESAKPRRPSSMRVIRPLSEE